MGIMAKESGGGGYEPVEEGMHQAVCYGVYDLGTQFNERYNNSQHKVLLCWEFPEIRVAFEKDGKEFDLPKAIYKEYTLSLGEKANLRKDLQTWRGKSFTKEELLGFDITKLLGVNCLIQVVHNESGGKVYANISTIVPVPQKQWVNPENEPRYYSIEEGMDLPENTPKWIQDKILNSQEFKSMGHPDDPQDDPAGPVPPIDAYNDTPPEDDGIPF